MTDVHFYFSVTAMITFWCLGLRAITDKGNIFYFLREPFEEKTVVDECVPYHVYSEMDQKARKGFVMKDSTEKNLDKVFMCKYKKIPTPMYAKPLIVCIWCMPSVWGSLIYFYFANGIQFAYPFDAVFYWVLCCVSASFWSGLLWSYKTMLTS